MKSCLLASSFFFIFGSGENYKISLLHGRTVIILVGVAHVIDLRAQIERIIMEEQPDVVAVELDYGRYVALTSKTQGEMPYFYRKMAEMQKNLADMFGNEVGSEMLTAVHMAQIMGKRVAFIDMDSEKIVQSIKKNMGLWEKIKLYGSLIFAPFLGKKITKGEVEKLIEEEDKYIEEIRKKYPGLSKALFDDREEYMAKNLLSLDNDDTKILAFVGDGHLKGLKKRLPQVQVIRLRDMRTQAISFSYSVEIQ